MVQIHPDPPLWFFRGAIAQLGERLLCKQEVGGSIPPSSTIHDFVRSVCSLAVARAAAAFFKKLGKSNRRMNTCVVFVTCTLHSLLNVTQVKFLRLYGQANKRMWWMPRRQKAMKDVVACEKPRGAGKQALIRGCPNGETRPQGHLHLNI